MTDVFSTYPTHPFQDDTYLSKPDAAYEWLSFHDSISSRVFSQNDWELAPYLSTPILGFHHLFASQTRAWAQPQHQQNEDEDEAAPHPFTTSSAPWAAVEATKTNQATLHSLASTLSPALTRNFTSPATLSTDLVPYLLRLLSPGVNPTLVIGNGADRQSTAAVRKQSELALVGRAVTAMRASGVRFDKTRVSPMEASEGAAPGPQQAASWVYRMEPALDELGAFTTAGPGFGVAGGKSTRFAVRQVLEQEFRKEEQRRAELARLERLPAGSSTVAPQLKRSGTSMGGDQDPSAGNKRTKVVRDFFGRIVVVEKPVGETDAEEAKRVRKENGEVEGKVWISYHEGFSNAVRKPLTLAELMREM
jgi:chromosome transmission fidelity protein 18